MAAFLLLDNDRDRSFHVQARPSLVRGLIADGFLHGVKGLQVDCDELLHAANILYQHGIPWTFQERVVTITDSLRIALILTEWNHIPYVKDEAALHVITA